MLMILKINMCKYIARTIIFLKLAFRKKPKHQKSLERM
ncbi:hypothetical protein BHF72_0599 [Cloacibacterium normanense]|uniref:Uncharacterized protein n=1 Tax=Cloacibacterium normanense TaxID=237258 RepID=A0A1E5UC57_9FLAO|nr:hypothetical protein BHF72_0599 [Cloacibacterium normanense]